MASFPETSARLLAEARPGDNAAPLSVSELSGALKRMVEDRFGHVRLRGEISGYKRVASGHAYLTLKDERACIDAVIWKTSFGQVPFAPEDGIEVIATGKLTTYPGRSKYQIVIERLEIAGEGALMLLLEKLRLRLAGEGLFAATRKRKLPYLPRTIGVVTSPTGAVIRDILHRLEDRCPTRVLVWPVQVQGEGSAGQIAAAVNGFSAAKGDLRPDLVIVARGGGSIEDLWAFNEEVVVRAVAASTIPIISAVGHETDTTLCDHAADLRAPTPTAAAELAMPVRAELLGMLGEHGGRIKRCANRYRERGAEKLAGLARLLPRPERLLEPQRRRVGDADARLRAVLSRRLGAAGRALERSGAALRPAVLTQRVSADREKLARLWRLAQSLHPDRPLGKGYARIEKRGGGVIANAGAARSAGALTLVFGDGAVEARVERPAAKAYTKPVTQPDLF